MLGDLANKVIVVTGGAQGIGYAIADQFLKEGAKITILLDINESRGVEAAIELTAKYGKNAATFLKCDVTTDLEVISEKIFSSHTVDVLINNAGIVKENLPKEMVDVNVTAVIEWSFKFWEHMRKDKGGNGGTIINLSSIYGFRVNHFAPIYNASKFAVMGFTKSLGHRINYERSGVRVVAICPGYTETEFKTNAIFRDDSKYDELKEYTKSQIWQKVDAVGEAAVAIYQRASSGTAWVIEGAGPVVEVTN